MASEVQRWRSGFRNQTAEALRQMGLNAARFGNTQQALGQIQAMSQTAVGRMQVLQAANQIAGMTVNEIQSLHGTIMAAEQAQINFKATEVQEREAQEQIQRNFMRDSGRRFF
jgi:P-type conjugative transfer protein TrbJ